MEPPLPPKQEPTEPIVVPAAAGGPACATPEDEARALKREARKKRRLEKRLEQEAKWREKRKTGRRPKSKSRLRARKFERLEQDAPKHTIVIDLSFDDKMNDREVRSICQQVAYCRSVNRRVQTPASIMCSSLNGRAAHRLTKILTGFSAWRHWSSDSRHFTELYPKEKLVYLSSEATTSLQTVDPDKVYVIGGLVDHNRHKGLTFNLATQYGIQTARLPIDEFIKLSTRKVLAVNHVFEILINWIATRDWRVAFERAIPKRKGATALEGGQPAKGGDSKQEEGGDDDDDDASDNEEDDEDDDEEDEDGEDEDEGKEGAAKKQAATLPSNEPPPSNV